MAADGFVAPPLDSDLPGDDVAMEFEVFDSIMQEPPDRNLMIKDQVLTDGFSFMPMPHSTNESTPSTFQYPYPQASPVFTYPEEQASSTFRSSDELDEECKQQVDLNYTLQEDGVDCLPSPSPGSSQSGYDSDYSELLESYKPWPAQNTQQNMDLLYDYSRLQEPFTNDCGGTGNTMEDSKSNGSTTTTDSKPHEVSRSNKTFVDLTNDSESDCEIDFSDNQNMKASGKRSLPQWVRPAQNPPKAICIRSPPRDGFSLPSNFSIAHEKFQSCSNLPTIPRLPKSLDQSSFGIHAVQSINIDPRVANAISTSAFQENGFQRVPAFTKEDSLEEGIMTVPLLKHQRIALAWMQLRENGAECAGGILADDQGLGKTVSTIALILKSKPPASNRTIENAQNNFTEASTVDLDDDGPPIKQLTWISGSACEPVANSRGRPAAGTLIVCPTSVLRQWAQELKDKITEAAALTVHVYHGGNRTRDPLELSKHDIVLTTYQIVTMEVPKQPLPEEKDSDDRNPGYYGLSGQFNNKKKGGKSNKGGDSDNLDNAKAGPLAKVAWFRVILDEAQSIKNRRTQSARACWGLRAKRRWCLSGTPIQNTIDDLYSYFRFLKYDPFCVYKEFRSQIKEPIHRNPTTGYLKLQVILNKILLRRTKSTLIDGEPIISLPKKNVKLAQVEFSAEERSFYSNLETQSREQFQMYAAQGTVQNNYVNILWMLLRLRQACDHPRLVKGGGSDVGKSIMEKKTKLSEEQRANLLVVLEKSCQTCSICSDAPEDPVISLCSHIFCKQCICDKVAYDETSTSTCPINKCQTPLSLSKMYSLSDLNDPGSTAVSEPSLHLDLQPFSTEIPESSSKIRAVINTLRALPPYETPKIPSENVDGSRSHVRTEKAIVFSQWTSMLDLLEDSLKKEGFCYRRLDGTMSIQARDRALHDFKHLPDVNVIIMSLKAASLGLNMITASHVLLIDVWWNPTTEDQAIDRAHRIGQTREVHVSRFTVKNTIEDRILQLQDRKRQIVASAFGEDAGSDQKTRLTVEEMSFLFSG